MLCSSSSSSGSDTDDSSSSSTSSDHCASGKDKREINTLFLKITGLAKRPGRFYLGILY